VSWKRRVQLEQHVVACDACARMGGDVAAMVAAVRAQLGAERAPDDVADRLLGALKKL